MLSIKKVRAKLGAVDSDVPVHTSWYKTLYIMSHGDSNINDNFKIVFLNIYVITNTFISLLKLIVFLQSCMNVYINIIVMVNIFLENMNVITDIYRSFSIFFKKHTYTFSLFQTPHMPVTTRKAAIRSGKQKMQIEFF